MKSQKSIRTTLLFVLCMIAAGSCDKSGGGDDLGGIYLPDFSNDWTVVKGTATGDFFINATITDSAKGLGTLTANENLNDINNTTYNLQGSFQNIQVTLGYLTNAENGGDNGPRAGFTYKGIYDTTKSPHLLRLLNVNNSSDSLVLKKGS
jgi:hypothetical protein